MTQQEPFERYVDFIVAQINYFTEQVQLVKSNVINPIVVNAALARYATIGLALDGEYNRIEWELDELKLEYNAWWDQVFVETKIRLNPLTIAAQKWASIKEIEAHARYENRDKFQEWQNKLKVLEHKLSFYRRMRDRWEKHLSNLQTLSSNLKQEMKTINLDNEPPEHKPPSNSIREDDIEVRGRKP